MTKAKQWKSILGVKSINNKILKLTYIYKVPIKYSYDYSFIFTQSPKPDASVIIIETQSYCLKILFIEVPRLFLKIKKATFHRYFVRNCTPEEDHRMDRLNCFNKSNGISSIVKTLGE